MRENRTYGATEGRRRQRRAPPYCLAWFAGWHCPASRPRRGATASLRSPGRREAGAIAWPGCRTPAGCPGVRRAEARWPGPDVTSRRALPTVAMRKRRAASRVFSAPPARRARTRTASSCVRPRRSGCPSGAPSGCTVDAATPRACSSASMPARAARRISRRLADAFGSGVCTRLSGVSRGVSSGMRRTSLPALSLSEHPRHPWTRRRSHGA